jgi:hypothetical protein
MKSINPVCQPAGAKLTKFGKALKEEPDVKILGDLCTKS